MCVPSGPLPPPGRRDCARTGARRPCAGRAGGERGLSVTRWVLLATCSDGARSAASYRGLGLGS